MADVLDRGIIVPSSTDYISTTGVEEIRTLGRTVVQALNSVQSAYDLAVKAGYKGTVDQWLDSLVGEPGPEGPYGGTTVTDPQVASYVSSETQTRSALLSKLTTPGTQPLGKDEITVNAHDYGASTTSADNTAAIAQSLSKAATFGIPAVIPAGRYTMMGTLTIPSGVDLQMHGVVLDFSQSTDTVYVSVRGELGDRVPVTDARKGQFDVKIPGHTFKADQWLKISSDDLFDAKSTGIPLAEMVQIKEVSDGVVSLWAPLRDTYTTNVRAQLSTPAKDIRISGGEILGNGIPASGYTGMNAELVVNMQISGTAFRAIDKRQMYLSNCVNCWVTDCYFERALPNTMGYGVSFGNATRDCGAMRCRFVYVRHALSTNNDTVGQYAGVVRNIMFAFNTVENSAPSLGGDVGGATAIDTHTAAEEIDILYNRVNSASATGIQMECASGRVIGNLLIDPVNLGIYVHNESDRDGDFIISGNVIRRSFPSTNTGIRASCGLRGGAGRIINLAITDNIITGHRIGIQVGRATATDDGTKESNVCITGNMIRDCTNYGIYGERCSGVVCANNTVYGTEYGIRFMTSEFLTIGPDTIVCTTAPTFIGVEIRTCSRARIQPGAIKASETGIRVYPDCSDVTIGAYSHIDSPRQVWNTSTNNVVAGA